MEPLERANLALIGLSVGDAFGDNFFIHPDIAHTMIHNKTLPKPVWRFTDDTNMALSIFTVLRRYQQIEQTQLARSFAERYDSSRGYGPSMHRLLRQILETEDWKTATQQAFEGQGSYGNGAAMRVAPVGAYFSDNLQQVAIEAQKSAEITHSHPEGIAGAIAVAIAAACAWNIRGESVTRKDFIHMVLPHIPESEVKSRLKRAAEIQSTVVDHVIGMIGNGSQITAQDTVPFALWCAAGNLNNFERALWTTSSGLGDVDTNCAIVGGIIALYTGAEGIPHHWLQHRETLPNWAFQDSK